MQVGVEMHGVFLFLTAESRRDRRAADALRGSLRGSVTSLEKGGAIYISLGRGMQSMT
jgi:hypothetical protein